MSSHADALREVVGTVAAGINAKVIRDAADHIEWLEARLDEAPVKAIAVIDAEYNNAVTIIDSLIDSDDPNDRLAVRKKGIEWGIRMAFGSLRRWDPRKTEDD